MPADIFLEVDRSATDFLDELKRADSSAQSALEEQLAGNIDLTRIALTLTPAVAFVIGRYFSYLEKKVLSFTVREPDGRVVAAKGDSAEHLLDYIKRR